MGRNVDGVLLKACPSTPMCHQHVLALNTLEVLHALFAWESAALPGSPQLSAHVGDDWVHVLSAATRLMQMEAPSSVKAPSAKEAPAVAAPAGSLGEKLPGADLFAAEALLSFITRLLFK